MVACPTSAMTVVYFSGRPPAEASTTSPSATNQERTPSRRLQLGGKRSIGAQGCPLTLTLNTSSTSPIDRYLAFERVLWVRVTLMHLGRKSMAGASSGRSTWNEASDSCIPMRPKGNVLHFNLHEWRAGRLLPKSGKLAHRSHRNRDSDRKRFPEMRRCGLLERGLT